jgi:uncharacterized protein (TIGR02757 family)
MVKRVSNRHQEALRLTEELFLRYDRRFVTDDPVGLVHNYQAPADRELTAFISAMLAFGNVKAIHGSLKKVFAILGPHPSEFLAAFDFKKETPIFDLLGHRWVRGGDIRLLLATLQKIYKKQGSLEAFFLEGYDDKAADVGPMLVSFSKRIKQKAGEGPLSRGFSYFFPSPVDGSPCKRLNMFLRWVVRPADGIDLGLWKGISPSQLLVPLDVHLFNFTKKFKLSRHRNPNWKMARDLTDFLKTLDPADPVKYDFALCHHGMTTGYR